MTTQARHGRTASIKRCVTTDPETVDVIYRRWNPRPQDPDPLA